MTLSKVLISEKSAAATQHFYASVAARDALQAGGNFADAAVAASSTLSVVQHHLGGLGGDFFALAYEAKTGKVHCLNSSGWSPASSTLDFLHSRGFLAPPREGPHSVVIPGLALGLGELHKKFGTLPFKSLFGRAIRLAEDGFPVADGFARAIASNYSSLSDDAKGVFAPEGRPPKPGEIIRQPSLSRTLKSIAENGASDFYTGWIAESISDELTRLGVPVTLQDFKMTAEWPEPLQMNYNGYELYEIPPNSMGATTLLMLELLQESDLKESRATSTKRIEIVLEAARTAYARRDEDLGDPNFVEFRPESFFAKTPTAQVRNESLTLAESDTTSFAITDRDGNILSAIQSVFRHFGSRVFVKESGIFLNNRAFAFKAAGPNKLEPHKRPLHTLSSILMGRGGSPSIALGTSGAEFRPQLHALFISNIADYQMNLEEAIDHPRFLWDGRKEILLEGGLEKPNISGQSVKPLAYPGPTGVAHGVERLGKSLKAVCDVRGDGLPAGE